MNDSFDVDTLRNSKESLSRNVVIEAQRSEEIREVPIMSGSERDNVRLFKSKTIVETKRDDKKKSPISSSNGAPAAKLVYRTNVYESIEPVRRSGTLN